MNDAATPPPALKGVKTENPERILRLGFRQLRDAPVPSGEVRETCSLLGLPVARPSTLQTPSCPERLHPAPRHTAPAKAKVQALPRRGFFKLALPMAVALTLGSAAGVWVTSREPAATPERTLQLYEEAAKAYERFKPEQAVKLVSQAVRGPLQLPQDLYLGSRRRFAFRLSSIGSNNGRYALALAESGQLKKALEVNRLTARIADQLLEGKTFGGIEARMLYKDELRVRKDLYLAAGDRESALATDREMQRKQALHKQKVSKLMHELIVNRGLYLTWPKGDKKVAQMEADLERRIREIWRPEPE